MGKGAKTDQAGRWYCGPGCRTTFRLHHDTSHKETPHVPAEEVVPKDTSQSLYASAFRFRAHPK